ncbi:hypothetical protein GMORB2_1896 [Geosmithia morbida]|uniref:Uncharacterized protein n=1 Tax=Geosmithia morbida TaxID=1094350 RepID=A0A9P5D4H0_9HYPO|nr:uncharacterized protein GMORB2_1896 [Geosmithia morbida]KAF4121489.1 hypothetical protein GMORB2_1896 [Geosmithia morbida]
MPRDVVDPLSHACSLNALSAISSVTCQLSTAELSMPLTKRLLMKRAGAAEWQPGERVSMVQLYMPSIDTLDASGMRHDSPQICINSLGPHTILTGDRLRMARQYTVAIMRTMRYTGSGTSAGGEFRSMTTVLAGLESCFLVLPGGDWEDSPSFLPDGDPVFDEPPATEEGALIDSYRGTLSGNCLIASNMPDTKAITCWICPPVASRGSESTASNMLLALSRIMAV